MKEYKKANSYKLGLNINIYNNVLNYYVLDYKYHGYYYYSFLINNELNISKGFFNKGIIYSHWKDNYHEEYNYRYHL